MTKVNNVNERIRDFILEKFPLARKRGVTFQDDLLEGGVLDSLGILDVVAFLEQDFRIHVNDEELIPENFQSIDRLSIFVQDKISCAAQPQ
jgi:acyl carrier protein